MPEGAGVGSVLRAEVETTLDGTTVTALTTPKEKEIRPVQTIEVLGTPQRGPDVNVVLTSKSKRRRDERPDGPKDGARRARSEGSDRRPRADGGRLAPIRQTHRRRESPEANQPGPGRKP